MLEVRRPADGIEINKFGNWALITCIFCGHLAERGPYKTDAAYRRARTPIMASALVRDHPAACKER